MHEEEKDLALRLMDFYENGENVYCYDIRKDESEIRRGKATELAIEIPYNTYLQVREEGCYHAKVQTRYNEPKVIKDIGKYKPIQEDMLELANYMIENGWEIKDTHENHE